MNADALIATPGPVTYCTPRINMGSLIEVDQIAEHDDEFNDLQFSAHGSSSQAQGVGLHVAESNNTNLGAQNETRLFSVSADFGSDKIESSLEPFTKKRNAAANEHEQEQKCALNSEAAPQTESLTNQEAEDGEHARGFIVPVVPEVTYSIIDERNFVGDALDAPSIDLPMEEASLFALSQPSDEFFGDGFEPECSRCSCWFRGFPHAHGFFPYPIATLAKTFNQLGEYSKVVLL